MTSSSVALEDVLCINLKRLLKVIQGTVSAAAEDVDVTDSTKVPTELSCTHEMYERTSCFTPTGAICL